MNKMNIKRLSLGAMFSALIFIATFISIPLSSYGNINLGDSFILICSIVMGYYGVLPSAIGASFCDVLTGYSIYAPGTFLIKGIMSLVFVYFFKILKGNSISLVIAMIISEVIMVIGYLLYELILFGNGAFGNVPFNIIQGVINILISLILYRFISKMKIDI